MSTTFPGSKGKDIGDSQIKDCLVGDVNMWGINLLILLTKTNYVQVVQLV